MTLVLHKFVLQRSGNVKTRFVDGSGKRLEIYDFLNVCLMRVGTTEIIIRYFQST